MHEQIFATFFYVYYHKMLSIDWYLFCIFKKMYELNLNRIEAKYYLKTIFGGPISKFLSGKPYLFQSEMVSQIPLLWKQKL